MASKNPTDLITGYVCTFIAICIAGGFTYFIFVEDYVYRRSAVITRAVVTKVEEKKEEKEFQSMGKTEKTTVSSFHIHYTFKVDKVEIQKKKEISKQDFDRYSKDEARKKGLKVFYQRGNPKDVRPDFERRKGGSFWYVVAAVYAVSGLLLWVGIESLYYA